MAFEHTGQPLPRLPTTPIAITFFFFLHLKAVRLRLIDRVVDDEKLQPNAEQVGASLA